MKICHIYVCNAKSNIGDVMIGIAYKKYVSECIFNEPCDYDTLDCRNGDLFNIQNISKLNKYDAIVVGGGGLILPDSTPNKVSCWQWVIPKESYLLIKKPIYVLSIGWNLFYDQTINMPNRNNNIVDKSRYSIFKSNIEALIEKSKIFTLRHKKDVVSLKNIVDEIYHNKISYEPCHTIWYVSKYWKPKILSSNKKRIAFELKDDRIKRRYNNEERFYKKIIEIIKYSKIKGYEPYMLSHDGSSRGIKYITNKTKIPVIKAKKSKEDNFIEMYNSFDYIVCSAGHSQMLSYGVGKRIFSIDGHPKIRNFVEDMNIKDPCVKPDSPDFESIICKWLDEC